MKLKTVILAAGQGKRMKSQMPKVLHKIGGLPMLEHVYNLAASLDSESITVIYGHGGSRVPSELEHLPVTWVEQREQLGTGHALMQIQDSISDDERVLVLYGDVPLLKKSTLQSLLQAGDPESLALLTIELKDPKGYGRIVRNQNSNRVSRIVEDKDASAAEKQIAEVNTGILVVAGKWLKRGLAQLTDNNAQCEYYLTDIIEFLARAGCRVEALQAARADEVLGVNDRVQLASLERLYQKRIATHLMENGVTLKDPNRFDLRGQIQSFGQDIEIDVNVVLEGKIVLGNHVRIGPNCVLRDVTIGDQVEILPHTVIEEAVIGDACRIGPFSRIRPQTRLADQVHIGNFVELKKSSVASASKINHLSYIGDTSVGSKVNIGAGTITCNYDGANKYQTIIEDGVFIGSDTQLIAPVKVRKNATIGAGSTITKEVPEDELTLSRAKQYTIKGWERPRKNRGS